MVQQSSLYRDDKSGIYIGGERFPRNFESLHMDCLRISRVRREKTAKEIVKNEKKHF